jgi:hypothetical protein
MMINTYSKISNIKEIDKEKIKNEITLIDLIITELIEDIDGHISQFISQKC